MSSEQKRSEENCLPPVESFDGKGFSPYEGELVWRWLRKSFLKPDIDFDLQLDAYNDVSRHWDESKYGPFPAWRPDPEDHTNAGKVIRELGLSSFSDLYQWSITEREAFWQKVIDILSIRFRKDPHSIVDLSDGSARPQWLPGASMNIAESCFTADGDQTAIVWRNPGQDLQYMTYRELELQTNRLANSLRRAGFQPGDALAVDMIMNVESVIIYLGVLKAGCRIISIADSFTPEEIAVRLRIGRAAGIFTMDTIPRGEKRLPMYAKVVEAGAPKAIVLPCGDTLSVELREGDLAWSDFLVEEEAFDTAAGPPDDFINILFSSGTTGEPKAITWNHTTPLKAAMDAHFHHDVRPGDVVAWPTNLGWMMGPWLIFASLLNRATIALYGDAPVGRGFCEFVQDAGVNMLGVVPSLVKAWKHSGAIDGLDWSSIRAFSSTGECSNPQDMLYLMSRAGYKPVIEYCGGTEIGGGYLCGSMLQNASPSTFSTPALGLELVLLDEEGQPADEGELFLIPPSIGLSVNLLNKDHYKTYYEGTPPGPDGRQLRRHGDQLSRMKNGYYKALGRADDTMNLGGIKTSSAELERVLKEVEGVDETAAIAVPPPGGGPSMLVVYAVLLNERDPEALKTEMQKAIRAHLNPLFKIHAVEVVEALPRTASGKVMRRVLRRRFTEGQ